MSASGRMRRVDEAIRQVLGGAMAGELKDPRVGFVTVTDVRTSADLRHARVYVSVLSDDGGVSPQVQREATLDGLRSAHGYLQGRIASELRLKRTPALEFSYDDTTDRALRVEELLEQAGPEVGRSSHDGRGDPSLRADGRIGGSDEVTRP
jgi:ribosome-binding factor A